MIPSPEDLDSVRVLLSVSILIVSILILFSTIDDKIMQDLDKNDKDQTK